MLNSKDVARAIQRYNIDAERGKASQIEALWTSSVSLVQWQTRSAGFTSSS
jgi:hypothetical protein